MSRYRRANIGTTFFFTVVAYQRRPILCDSLIRTALRNAIRAVRVTRPFSIDGWVLLPDHMHCIWTLPPDDTAFSQRWSQIKHRVSYACGDRYRMRGSDAQAQRGEATIWQRRFLETASVMMSICNGTSITFISIRSSMDTRRPQPCGRIRRSAGMWMPVCMRRIGAEPRK